MKKTGIVLVAALLLLSLTAVAYAHSGDRTTDWGMSGHMFSDEGMDEMHEFVTQDLDPEFKE